MESEILFAGMGGQGIQLAAMTLGRAAILDGNLSMIFGSYGGNMRGGNSNSTIVVGDGPIRTPPTVTSARFAIGMHHQYWSKYSPMLRPNGLVIVNTTVYEGDWDAPGCQIIRIEASRLAADAGAPQSASMIALGAFAAATQLVTLASLEAGALESLPPYRRDKSDGIVSALRLGSSLVAEPLLNAWSTEEEKALI